MSLRRWAALLGSAVLAAVGLGTTPNTATAAPPPTQTVHVCPQHLPAGYYTCFAERRVPSPGDRSLQQATVSGYHPVDLQAAYGLSAAAASNTGTRPRVYVVDAFDDPHAESDLATYRSKWAMSACTTGNGCFQKLNQNGAVAPLPLTDQGWAGEISLDLDMVSAICPRCGITLVEANSDNNDLLSAVRTATNLGARFVSMSWGGVEDGHEAHYDGTFFAKKTGVVYAAATGDDGYGAVYPATSPRAVAVGGTTLMNPRGARTETAWSDAGSGCSSDLAKPAWQQQNSQTAAVCSTHRAEADVSAVADPDPGVAVYNTYDGGWTAYGGTSAAAPIIAAAYALVGVPTASASPAKTLYDHTSQLYDPTSGSNGPCGGRGAVCQSGVGWDGPTGLGTLNGTGALTPGADPSARIVTIAYPGARTGRVGASTRFQLTGASYPGGGGAAATALTYSASGLPPGVTISKSGLISGTPTRAGNYAPVVIATDGHGGKSSTSFRWPVTLVCSARLVTNSGFESGAKSWQASKNIVHKLARRAHRGSHFVRLDGRGHAHTDTLSRTVAMPLGCSATLSYYLKVTTKDRGAAAHDRMRLTVNGRTVQSRTNRSASATYRHIRLNLSRYDGKSITISWIGRENHSRATSFYLDDISINLRK